jgi:uncharacterized membrane-anchored protein YhcB (DUF1043 family)
VEEMSEAVLVALITGGVSLFGSILTIILTSRKQQQEMDKSIAVIKTEMKDMKEDIKNHNRYAQLFSENIPAIKQHMVDVDRRLNGLERSNG